MAYTPQYAATDTSAVTIDVIVGFLVQVGQFIALITLVVLAVWFKKNIQSLRK